MLPLSLTRVEFAEGVKNGQILYNARNWEVLSCSQVHSVLQVLPQAPQLCVGSQDETLSIGSPEGDIPSSYAGLQHHSFCAPHVNGLQLVPHLLLSISRIVHVGWGLTVFTQDTKVHCVHLSWLSFPFILSWDSCLRSGGWFASAYLFLLLIKEAWRGQLRAGPCQH